MAAKRTTSKKVGKGRSVGRPKKEPEVKGCTIPGCAKTWVTGGKRNPDICPMHYHRERRESVHANDAAPVSEMREARDYLAFRPVNDVTEALKKQMVKRKDPSLSATIEALVTAQLKTIGAL